MLERRIRAAQQLAGFDSLDDMADKIGRPGLSRKTLRRIASENDPRTAKDYELEWIAAACSVPIEFLTAADMTADTGIADRLRAIEESIAARNEHDQIVEALLARQSQILTRIEALLSALQAPAADREPAESVESLAPKGLQALRESLTPKPSTQQPSEETHQTKRSEGQGA